MHLRGQRYYSPGIGRWISRDLIGEWGGLCLYAFVGNGPINAIDLFGFADGPRNPMDPPKSPLPRGPGVPSPFPVLDPDLPDTPHQDVLECAGSMAECLAEALDVIHSVPRERWKYCQLQKGMLDGEGYVEVGDEVCTSVYLPGKCTCEDCGEDQAGDLSIKRRLKCITHWWRRFANAFGVWEMVSETKTCLSQVRDDAPEDSEE